MTTNAIMLATVVGFAIGTVNGYLWADGNRNLFIGMFLAGTAMILSIAAVSLFA